MTLWHPGWGRRGAADRSRSIPKDRGYVWMPRLRQETRLWCKGWGMEWRPGHSGRTLKELHLSEKRQVPPTGLEVGKKACYHSGSGRGRKYSHKKSKPQVCALCRFRALIDTVLMLQNSETQNSAECKGLLQKKSAEELLPEEYIHNPVTGLPLKSINNF